MVVSLFPQGTRVSLPTLIFWRPSCLPLQPFLQLTLRSSSPSANKTLATTGRRILSILFSHFALFFFFFALISSVLPHFPNLPLVSRCSPTEAFLPHKPDPDTHLLFYWHLHFCPIGTKIHLGQIRRLGERRASQKNSTEENQNTITDIRIPTEFYVLSPALAFIRVLFLAVSVCSRNIQAGRPVAQRGGSRVFERVATWLPRPSN